MKDCVEAHPEYYGAMADVDDDDDAMEGEIVNEGEEPAAESEVEEPVTAEGAAIQETQTTQTAQETQETQAQTQETQTQTAQETQTQTNQETQTA